MLDSLVRVSRRVKQTHFTSKSALRLVDTGRKKHPEEQYVHTPTSPNTCFKHTNAYTRMQSNPPQEYYHSCACMFKCVKSWHTKQESLYLEPHRSVRQAPQSHPAKSNLFTFCSANTNSFNSLFKVLFIFPSWYLCTISLNHIFTFT